MIWDTAEHEKYHHSVSFPKAASGIFMVFDLASRISFSNLLKWWRDVEKLSYTGITVLLGTKSDLRNEREISYEEAKGFADMLNIPYLEVSAKNGKNVENAFEVLLNMAIKQFSY